LYAALASFLDARSHQGQWLLRIDDLDTPRNVKGAADNILKTLELFGLTWDGRVAYQSQCLDVYNDILTTLTKRRLVYPCSCSRKTLATSHPEARPPC
jgi:glutamyl-Q tRNA(Asp) synthetase